MVEPYEFKRLRMILDGDGNEIRQQFILAGLLLTVFERFKTYVVDRVDGFFSHRVDIKDGELNYVRGDKFKRLIKEKGVGKPGQHANKEFRAALHWFHELGAITDNEFSEIERIYARRNEIGHELFHIIADDRADPIKLEDVLTALSAYSKVVRWWVREVEATTDPDYDQEKYDSTDWNSVESAETIFLREIIRKALFGNMEWGEIERLAHAGAEVDREHSNDAHNAAEVTRSSPP